MRKVQKAKTASIWNYFPCPIDALIRDLSAMTFDSAMTFGGDMIFLALIDAKMGKAHCYLQSYT